MTPLARELAAIWPWLPVFRAIAETEHLPTAASQVGLSVPALSRTLGQLEDQLGLALFERVRGRLVLAPLGEQLLNAVQQGMSAVETGLAQIRSDLDGGDIKVSCGGHVAHHVARAALRMRETEPDTHVLIKATTADEVVGDLKAAHLDVAFTICEIPHPALLNVHLGHEPCAVYVGASHPLFGRERVAADELLSYPFAAPPEKDGAPVDGWPAALVRDIGIRVEHLSMAVEMCRSGDVLVVLPVTIAGLESDLWRLKTGIEASIPTFAVRRRRFASQQDRVDRLIDLVRLEQASASAETA